MIAEPQDRRSFGVAAIATAALACLQPGIDPVFLTLLSSAGRLDPANHGWIVGATQTGMALGALVAWRSGDRLPRHSVTTAALLALIAAIGTLHATSVWTLIPVRMLYGGAMGLIYTQVMSNLAAERSTSAYGIVFLVQLILSTLVALVLPAIAQATSPSSAVTALFLLPLAIVILGQCVSGSAGTIQPRRFSEAPDDNDPTPKAAWALLSATFWFICTTMMVWSFSGALAIAAGIGETTIGHAVAIGSVIGVATAAIVARDRPILPLILCGPLAGLSLLAPLFMTQPGQDGAFILSIGLLNIGSTAMIIRCSGAASERGGTAFFRRLVAASHSLGMIAGPVIGATLTYTLGMHGLAIGALCALSAACIALLAAAYWEMASDGRVRAVHLVRALAHIRPYR